MCSFIYFDWMSIFKCILVIKKKNHLDSLKPLSKIPFLD